MSERIQQEDHPERGLFFIDEGGERLAKMTYTRDAGAKRIVIQHTVVDPKLRGRGIAGKLVHAAADWARKDGLTIEPVCTFARAVFDKDRSLDDVRAR